MPKKLRMIIMIIAAIVFVVSSGQIFWHYYQLYVASKAHDSILEEVVAEEEPVEVEEEEDPFSTISIDFEALYAINSEINSWLYIPGTPVSYPILFGTNNQKYLTTTFDKKSNILGSIFMDYRNDPGYQDLNTIIYGHNTKNDAMFGSLKKYKDQEYADERLNVHILTENEVRLYEIFSVYETPATSDTYTISFASRDSYANYLKEMASKSVVSAGSPPGKTDPIITLSTCTGGAKVMRLVLQAKLIKVYQMKAGPS